MSTALHWLAAHWMSISPIALVVVSSLINRKVGSDHVQTIWHVLADILAVLPQKGALVTMAGMGPVNAPVKLPLFMRSHHDGPANLPPPPSVSILLPVIFFALAMQGCAHVSPATKEWAQNFKSCLIANGLQSLGNEGPQIFNILDTGGSSPGQIEQQIESVLVSSSGAVIEDVAICAVQAWENMHPVPPDAPPTTSQAAARVFVARHAKATTVKW